MIQCTKCKEWFHRQCAGLVPRKAWRSKECILLSGIVVDARIEVTCMYNIYGLYDISMLYCICGVVHVYRVSHNQGMDVCMYNGLKCIPP